MEVLSLGSVAKLPPKANTPDLYKINSSLHHVFLCKGAVNETIS